MTTTATAAQVVTVDGYGDHDITVLAADDNGTPITPLDSRPTTEDLEEADWDLLLADMGYRRTSAWTPTDFGGCAAIEPA